MSAVLDRARPLRADAERNRRRLLDVAADVFAAQGLEVGVAEIAERAEIGRGTLFRNFPTKQDLIAAVVVDRMRTIADGGRTLLATERDAGKALLVFLGGLLQRGHVDRALFEALADSFLDHGEIRDAHAAILEVLEALLNRAQAAGAVREDVCAVDLLIMVKGICAAARAFPHSEPELAQRQFDLLRASLTVAAAREPLRGRTLGLGDIHRSSLPA